MASILVTVGMSGYPFDRLLTAVGPLCAYHDVFAQTGPSAVVPPCPHAEFVPLNELQSRLAEADVVITHAGATVRLVQRLGRLPLVVARSARLGEAPDDAQGDFLRAEHFRGRVHAVWDVTDLPAAVAAHARLSLTDPPPPPVTDEALIATMDAVSDRLLTRPARGRPARFGRR
jgi:UDP-N-acetylglucosamine transferase subunit ALG13